MIFYFSGTGNTRWAAERLAQETGERLLFIPDEMKKGKCEYKLISSEGEGYVDVKSQVYISYHEDIF